MAVGETTIEIYLQSNPNITKTIKVTVSEKPVVDQGVPTGTGSLELNPANLGLTTTAYTGEIELGGVNFTVTDCKQSSQNFYLSKTTGSIYNTSSIGNITSVVVKYALPTSQKGSAAAQHGIKLSDTPLLSKPAAYDLSIDESGNGKADVVYTPETANQGYFRFDVLNDKNLQIAGIVINYAN